MMMAAPAATEKHKELALAANLTAKLQKNYQKSLTNEKVKNYSENCADSVIINAVIRIKFGG